MGGESEVATARDGGENGDTLDSESVLHQGSAQGVPTEVPSLTELFQQIQHDLCSVGSQDTAEQAPTQQHSGSGLAQQPHTIASLAENIRRASSGAVNSNMAERHEPTYSPSVDSGSAQQLGQPVPSFGAVNRNVGEQQALMQTPPVSSSSLQLQQFQPSPSSGVINQNMAEQQAPMKFPSVSSLAQQRQSLPSSEAVNQNVAERHDPIHSPSSSSSAHHLGQLVSSSGVVNQNMADQQAPSQPYSISTSAQQVHQTSPSPGVVNQNMAGQQAPTQTSSGSAQQKQRPPVPLFGANNPTMAEQQAPAQSLSLPSVSGSAQQAYQPFFRNIAEQQAYVQKGPSLWNQSLSMFDPVPPYPENPTTSPQQLLGLHLAGSGPVQLPNGQIQIPDLGPVTNILHVVEPPYYRPTMNNAGGHNYGTGHCLALEHSTNLRQSLVMGSVGTSPFPFNVDKIEAAIPLSQQKHGDTRGRETPNDIRRNMAFLASDLPMPSPGFNAPDMEMNEELAELQRLVDAGIMKKDAPLYLSALKKQFNKQQGIPANVKHVTEWKIVLERESDHRYAARNGEVPPADSINVQNMGAVRVYAKSGGAMTDHMIASLHKVRRLGEKAAADRTANKVFDEAMAKSTKEINEGPDCDCQARKGSWTTVPEPGLL